ncbi:MAG: hypothetical protein ABI354_01090 [Candidatus Saccharimonadales bacterium]
MSEWTSSPEERKIIADSLKKLGNVVMSDGNKVLIGHSFWSSSLYEHGIFPPEGTVIETIMQSPSKTYAENWTEGFEVTILGEEVLSLGRGSLAPVSISQSLEYGGDDPDHVAGFVIYHDAFPDRVERRAQAVLGAAATLATSRDWFEQLGVDMSEVVVTHIDETLSPAGDYPVRLVPATEFAILAAKLAE